jgi:hypothetical protein
MLDSFFLPVLCDQAIAWRFCLGLWDPIDCSTCRFRRQSSLWIYTTRDILIKARSRSTFSFRLYRLSALTRLAERNVGGATFVPFSQSCKCWKSYLKLKVKRKRGFSKWQVKFSFLQRSPIHTDFARRCLTLVIVREPMFTTWHIVVWEYILGTNQFEKHGVYNQY